ncbi:hypothetical protein EDC01DRAFT_651140 [Geopyxis carbonaria]|nr:hypothetical protein EDC01DRAFT_651140 [Geopyxis carbonaria]
MAGVFWRVVSCITLVFDTAPPLQAMSKRYSIKKGEFWTTALELYIFLKPKSLHPCFRPSCINPDCYTTARMLSTV